MPAGRLGERVWVYGAQSYRPWGTAAEYVALPGAQAVRLPDAVDFASGACLGIPARTAHAAVYAGGPVAGLSVLVAGGAGNVGRAAVALAAWGGATVIATVGGVPQGDLARSAGAAHVLDYRAADVAARVRALTGDAGVTRIVEVAFGQNLPLDAAVIAQHGTITAYSPDADPEPRVPFWPLLFNNVTIRLVGSDDLSEAEEGAPVRSASSSRPRRSTGSAAILIWPLAQVHVSRGATTAPSPTWERRPPAAAIRWPCGPSAPLHSGYARGRVRGSTWIAPR